MSNLLGPGVSYCDLLDHEIEEKLKLEANEKRFPLRPSSGGYCARRLAFDLMEYRGYAHYEKEPMEPNVYRLLGLGHSVEYSALRNLEMLDGFSLRYKQQVVSLFRLDPLDPAINPTGQLIEGSVDVVLWSDKYKCVLDVKSAKDGFSAAYRTRWDEQLSKYDKMKSLTKISDTGWYADDLDAFIEELNGDFLADNMVQLNLYACSDFMRERGIDHAVIYKYGKNDSRHYEIRFRPSMKLFNQIKDKFNAINKAVEAKDPESIKCESFLGSMRCAFCPYKGKCWDTQDDAKSAWYKTFPKKDWPKDLRDMPEAEPLFDKFESMATLEKEKKLVETEILKIMNEKKIRKIKLANGNIYELKYLKTPSEHFELRRSKL